MIINYFDLYFPIINKRVEKEDVEVDNKNLK